MGGSTSSLASGGGIHVGTSRGAAKPGETVAGKVYLHVITELRTSGVRLRLCGNAHAIWFEGHSHSGAEEDAIEETLVFKGNDRFLSIEVPLMHACTLAPGCYEMPFELALPPSLPGTLHKMEEDARADVTYTLEATCTVGGLYSRNLVSSQELVVFAVTDPMVAASGSAASNERHEDVNLCCCFNRGRISARTTVSSDLIHPGDLLPLVVSADATNATVPIKKIKMRLEQDVTLRGSLHNVCRGPLHRYRLHSSSHFGARDNSSYDFRRCQRHMRTAATGQFRESREKTFTRVLNETECVGCDAGSGIPDREFRLTVPPMRTVTTTHTRVVSCTHAVTVKMETGPCMTNLVVRTPVTVASVHQHVFNDLQQHVLQQQQQHCEEPSAPMLLPNGIAWEPIRQDPVVVAVPDGASAPPMPMVMNGNISNAQDPAAQSQPLAYQQLPSEPPAVGVPVHAHPPIQQQQQQQYYQPM